MNKAKKQNVTQSSIQVDILHTGKGHLEMVLNGDNPKHRRKLSRKILTLIREHKAIIIVKKEDGQEVRVTGYDSKTNEWVVKPLTKKQEDKRVSAKGTKATVVAPISGG